MLNMVARSAEMELKLDQIVRNDRALAAAAATMNQAITRNLRASRVFTALAVILCGFVLYVVHQQGKTIESQRNLIQQLYRDNQELFKYRLENPPADQQPGNEQPSDDSGDPASGSKSGQSYRADGCVGGVCA